MITLVCKPRPKQNLNVGHSLKKEKRQMQIAVKVKVKEEQVVAAKDLEAKAAAGEAEVRFPAAEVEEEKEQAPVGLAAGSEVVVEAKAKAEAEEAGVEKEEAIVKMKKGKTKKTASRRNHETQEELHMSPKGNLENKPSELLKESTGSYKLTAISFQQSSIYYILSYHTTFDRYKLPDKSQVFSLKDVQKQIAKLTETDAKDPDNLPWHLWEEAMLSSILFHTSHFQEGPQSLLVLELQNLADFFCNKASSFGYYPYWWEEESELHSKVLEGKKVKDETLRTAWE
ncbi:hypothetical protein FB446DRAFT_797248 [Lentinula raphanica]|nr:hypothetical protein FB446DRAFT_797248 [Lentinula raphanica]